MSSKHKEGVFLILLLHVLTAVSDYQVKLQVSSYNNMASRCASCRNSASDLPGCCNTLLYQPMCPTSSTCELSAMMMCLRLLTGQYDEGVYRDIYRDKLQNDDTNGRQNYMRNLCGKESEIVIITTESTILHRLEGITRDYQGVQLIVVAWNDNNQQPVGDLVDIFILNITSPVGSQIFIPTYRGYHDIAQVSLSFQVACTNATHGPDCSQSCTSFCGNTSSCNLRHCCSGNANVSISEELSQMCSCDREYTTLLCQSNNNDCLGINCGSGICIDGVNSFRCQCNPGYQGSRCMDIIPNHSSPNIKIAVGIISVVVVLGAAAIAFYGVMYYTRNRKNKMQRLDDSYLVSEDFMK